MGPAEPEVAVGRSPFVAWALASLLARRGFTGPGLRL